MADLIVDSSELAESEWDGQSEPRDPSLRRFAVGQIWKDGSNRKWAVVAITDNEDAPLIVQSQTTGYASAHRADGRWLCGEDTSFDLVTLVRDIPSNTQG